MLQQYIDQTLPEAKETDNLAVLEFVNTKILYEFHGIKREHNIY
jgi:hypothetical protein